MLPAQTNVAVADAAIAGAGAMVMVVWAVSVQPFALVTTTLYVPSADIVAGNDGFWVVLVNEPGPVHA